MSSGSDYDSDTSFDRPGNISNFLEDTEWPKTTLAATLEELEDVSHPNTQGPAPAVIDRNRLTRRFPARYYWMWERSY
jgi:hypothetical protein